MRKKWTITIATLIIALLVACSTKDQKPVAPQSDEAAATTTTTTTIRRDEKEQEIKQAISDYVSEFYGEESVVRVSLTETKIEVRVRMDVSTENGAPDNWIDIVETAESVGGGLLDSLPSEAKQQNGILYLVDQDDNNLLSVLNGKASFSAFEEHSYAGENAPTISLEEFNAIRTGMTYQEVFDIVGSRGEKISESDLGFGDEYYTAMFQWEGEGSLWANANVMFQGGKVVQKAQFGLE